MRIITILVSLILLNGSAQSSPSSDNFDKVELLRFPFPYLAALTVASDTHANIAEPAETAVDRFEAVHKLINSHERIVQGSKEWNLLFKDPEITRQKRWEDGITGFGLPICDNFWLYDPLIGVYERFDPETQIPVTHSCLYGDYRSIIDRWFRLGWIDGLHTGGSGFVPREATRLGLMWLAEKPYRKVNFWVDHALGQTPSCIEPDVLKALPFFLKNLTIAGATFCREIGAQSFITPILQRLGAGGLAEKSKFLPIPPGQQRWPIWLFAIILLSSVLAAALCSVFARYRKLRNFLLFGIIFGISSLMLALIPMRYAQGDNPGSPYYCLDLVQQAGVRFFWPIQDAPGCKSLYPGLGLPEVPYGERRSFLRIITMDDGSKVMAFPRNYKGISGFNSLELLNDEALKKLCSEHRSSIIYTHWVVSASKVFSAEGLKGLETLRRYKEERKIWVAPTSVLLRFEYARTFLRFSTHREGNINIVEIQGIESPIKGLSVPEVEELSGISFECRGDDPVEVRLAGVAVKPENLAFSRTDSSIVVQFPLIANQVIEN